MKPEKSKRRADWRRQCPTWHPCRHCRQRAARRPGRLCAACHAEPALRAQFPRTGRPLDYSGPAPDPATPTMTVPGTEEHLEVLCQRAREGVRLAAPGDLYYRETEAERLGRLQAALAPGRKAA